jgi:hypothetical protein
MKRRIEISTEIPNLNLTIPTPVDPRKLTKMYGFPSSLTQFFFNPTISLINLCLSSSETVGLNRKPTTNHCHSGRQRNEMNGSRLEGVSARIGMT